MTLERRGLVEFDTQVQHWHIGPRAFVNGARFLPRTSLVDRARPILRGLMKATGVTANLGIERDGAVLFVNQVESHANIRAFFPPGPLSPMRSSGIGKALLAEMNQRRLNRLLRTRPLEASTPQTITDPGRLRSDLQEVHRRGHSIDDEERNTGIRCIAAPVFDVNGEAVAGISISEPTARVGPKTWSDSVAP